MKQIIYSGFPINIDDLKYYLSSTKSSKKNSSHNLWRDNHSANLLYSIMSSMATNQTEFDANDPIICSLLEQIIREVGYDENGHYTQEAKLAMKNLNTKRGLPADFIELKDIQIKKNWSLKLKNLRKSISSACTEIVSAPRNLWKKGKKYILGAFIFGASLCAIKPAIGFFKSFIKSQTENFQNKPDILQASNDTTIWNEVAKDSAIKSTNTKDSLQKIVQNKQHYQKMRIKTDTLHRLPSSLFEMSPIQGAKENAKKQKESDTPDTFMSRENVKKLEQACNCAPSIVINDLVKKGTLPADYREKTLKKYFEKHPKSHVTEVPSRILLNDIQNIYTHSQKEDLQELSNYFNSNQKRFLRMMRLSQKKQVNQTQHIRNLKQLRDLRNR